MAQCGLWTLLRSSEVCFVSAGRQHGQAEALRPACLTVAPKLPICPRTPARDPSISIICRISDLSSLRLAYFQDFSFTVSPELSYSEPHHLGVGMNPTGKKLDICAVLSRGGFPVPSACVSPFFNAFVTFQIRCSDLMAVN